MNNRRVWLIAVFFSICAFLAFIGNLVYPHVNLSKQTTSGTYVFIPEGMPDYTCVYFVNQDKGTCLKKLKDD